MKSLRLAALAAALVLGACTSASPTDPAASASNPSFDGGGMLGTGNGVGTGSTEDGGNTLGSGNGISTGGGTTTWDTGGTTSNDTTTQRGPGMMGSGN